MNTSEDSEYTELSDSCGKPKKRRRRRSKSGCGCKKKSKRRKKAKKCMKPGPKTRNPFLNFLRVFRKKHCGWSITKIAVEGAKCWCKMTREQRKKYYMEACRMQKKGKKRRRSRKRGKC